MNGKPKTLLTKAIGQQLRGETAGERLSHRLHCVVLVLTGCSASEVARIYGDSPRAVAYWVSRFNEDGIVALKEEKRPGRPSKLNKMQMKRVQTFLHRAKAKSEAVNAEALAVFISSEFEISLTARHCWRILNKLKS